MLTYSVRGIPIFNRLVSISSPVNRFGDPGRGCEEARLRTERNRRRRQVLANRQGKIICMNTQMEGLFGYWRQESVGQPIEVLVPDASHDPHDKVGGDFLARPKTRAMGPGRDLFGRRKGGTQFRIEIGPPS